MSIINNNYFIYVLITRFQCFLHVWKKQIIPNEVLIPRLPAGGFAIFIFNTILINSFLISPTSLLYLEEFINYFSREACGYIPYNYYFIVLFLKFFILILFTFMGGIAAVPFYDIWGKSLPSYLRGRFFAYRQLWGGVLAIGSGFIAKITLGADKIKFPINFVLLFLFAFIFISISYIALGSVKEPIEKVYKSQLPFKDFLRKAFRIIREDNNYRKFITIQILAGTGAMALPFYILYLKDVLQIELGMVGILLSAQMLGSVLSNILWAHLSDFVGNKKVIQISSFFGLMVPIIALMTQFKNELLYLLLFAIIGFFIAGRTIGNTNYLLDIAPSKDRPIYISLTGTLLFPVSLFPLIGGLIVQYISYNMLFIITGIPILLGFILSFNLKEPRNIKIDKS